MLASKRSSTTCRFASFRPRSLSMSTPCALIFRSANEAGFLSGMPESFISTRSPVHPPVYRGEWGFLICGAACYQQGRPKERLLRDKRLLRGRCRSFLAIVAAPRRFFLALLFFSRPQLWDPP